MFWSFLVRDRGRKIEDLNGITSRLVELQAERTAIRDRMTRTPMEFLLSGDFFKPADMGRRMRNLEARRARLELRLGIGVWRNIKKLRDFRRQTTKHDRSIGISTKSDLIIPGY